MASSCDNQVSIGVLLAGGSARRAGVDTRFLVLGGRALLLRNLAFLRGFFPTVAVSLGAGQMLDLGDAHHASCTTSAWCASPRSSIWPAPSETATVGKKPRRKARLRKSNARPPSTRKRLSTPARRALLLRNLAFLRGFFPTVAVSLGAGQMLDLGDAHDAEVVHDAWPGASPLAGIASALARYRQPVFALAADIAFPDPEAIRRVLTAFPGHDLALPAIGPEYHQPLFAVYGPACLAPMTALLEADRHRIVEILLSLDVAEVRFPDDSLFHNINTMDDYEEARRQAAAGSDAPAAWRRASS